MAKSNGKFGALKHLTPSNIGISDILIDDENQRFKYRAEERLIEDRDILKKEKEDAKKKAHNDSYLKSLDKVGLDKTGNRSYDERIVDFYTREGGVIDKLNKFSAVLENDPYNKEALVGVRNLEKTAESINATTQALVAKRNEFQEGLESGLYSPSLNKGNLETMNDWFDNHSYKFDFKEDGTFFIQNEGYDSNGDGEINELDKLTLQDVMNPNKLQHKGLMFGQKQLQEFVTTVKDNYGKHAGKKEVDGKIIDTIGFDMSKLDNLKSDVDLMFGNDLNSINTNAKSFINDTLGKDWKSYSEEEFNDLKALVTEKIINKFDSTNKETTNWKQKEFDLKEKKFKHEKSQDWIKNNKDEEKENLNSLNIMKDGDGKFVEIDTNAGKAIGFTIPSKKINIGVEEVTVDKLYLTNNNEVVFDGTIKVPKHKGEKNGYEVDVPESKKKVSGGETPDLNKVANAYGFKDEFELVKAMKEQKGANATQKKEIKGF